MTARRSSRCPSCSGSIRKGDEITKRGRFYVCATCAGSPAEEPTHKQRYGRCEDAPCCGCCGNSGYGYETAYLAY